ncbi:MAG: T9SS type A sorting domain-containing protein, partial [Bacteroidota bacterium]
YLGNQRFAFSGRKLTNPNNASIAYIDENGNISYQSLAGYPSYISSGNTYYLYDISSSGDGSVVSNYVTFTGLRSIFKIDEFGNPLWDIPSSSISALYDVNGHSSGTTFVAGFYNTGLSFVLKVGANGELSPNSAMGKVFRNDAFNCAPTLPGDTIGLANWNVLFIQDQDTLSTLTDALGNYSLNLDSGWYEVEVIPPGVSVSTCNLPDSVFVGSLDFSLQGLDIQAVNLDDCSEMNVSIGTPFLRRCFDNTYAVQVCNYGSVVSDSILLTVVLDPFFDFIDAPIDPVFQSGDTLGFQLGQFDIGECRSLPIMINVSCDADLGQNHFIDVRVSPFDICLPPDPIWDGSSVLVTELCVTDSVQFILENVGSGDMTELKTYQIFRDLDVWESGSFQLEANEQLFFSLPADGSVWRFEAEQSTGHPGVDTPISFNADCGPTIINPAIVSMFPQNDGNPWIDIDCQQNIGAYDPNDKNAQPTGVGPEHYLEANTDLEYKIRFQNTGTDTAFNVVIRDTLAPGLNGYSLVMGASSHDYTYDLRNGNILVVTYDNIMLPDSNVNEPASNGFFQFRIQQQPDLPVGTIIENRAAIFFDFNEPIITNSYFHEIAEFPLTTSIETVERKEEGPEVRIMPNPFRGQTRIEVMSDRYTDLEFWVYDALGQRVDFKRFTGKQLDYQQNHLPKGVYVYEIRSSGQRLQSGKLMVQ